MKTLIFSVKVHSCLLLHRLVFEDQLNPDNEYVSMGNDGDPDPWYRALPHKCNCKKLVTYDVADDACLQAGSAECLWKVRKKSIERVNTSIWMMQQVKVPRIDLSTEADLERAFIDGRQDYIDYIDEIHKMYMENRQKLIVPFREELAFEETGHLPRPEIAKAILIR